MPVKKEPCCGCELCACICPQNAIDMFPDNDGFLYPHIDGQICTDCGLCEKICPIDKSAYVRTKTHNINIYSGYRTDNEQLHKSSSGGFVAAASEYIVNNGGCVFGVAYSDGFMTSEYICADSPEKLEKLSSSKYMQARKNDVYRQVEDKLKEGVVVLFTGLPCEAAALKSYLSHDYDNLYICELICHGVMSPKVSGNYITELEKKYNSTIKAFSSRCKTEGWLPAYVRAEFENGKIYTKPLYDTAYSFGLSVLCRPSCFACCFKGENRAADITAGDYWGLSKKSREYNKNGVSVIFVNTEKGDSLVRNTEGFVLNETDPVFAIENSKRLNSPCIKHSQYEELFKTANEKGLEAAYRKSLSFKGRIKRLIPTSVLKAIQKITN